MPYRGRGGPRGGPRGGLRGRGYVRGMNIEGEQRIMRGGRGGDRFQEPREPRERDFEERRYPQNRGPRIYNDFGQEHHNNR